MHRQVKFSLTSTYQIKFYNNYFVFMRDKDSYS